ncbi:MAG: helix-turn-helix domain-containing protein [Rickettsiales bacterium]|jgi:transcriptional regulator with XRE-family HTH domain|nr:helix-turn-helix domain-containing protein [Rickettsiales bacterium]
MEKASAEVMAARAGRLKRAREFIGLSQKNLSRELGLGDSTWQNYELRKSFPNINILEKLERMHGIDKGWLLDGGGEMLKSARAAGTDAVMEAAAFPTQPSGINGGRLFDMAFSALCDAYSGNGKTSPGEIAGKAYRMTAEILMAARTEASALDMLELLVNKEKNGGQLAGGGSKPPR